MIVEVYAEATLLARYDVGDTDSVYEGLTRAAVLRARDSEAENRASAPDWYEGSPR